MKQFCAWLICLPHSIYYTILIAYNFKAPPSWGDDKVLYSFCVSAACTTMVGLPLWIWYKWKDGWINENFKSI
jgi:hypothetical protein